MTFHELAIPGAWKITPKLHIDHRGAFFEWFTQDSFARSVGHQFAMRQANCSVSAAGTLRGLHFAQLPPSQAKYVTCVKGAVFDVIVDIRVGSPTFGGWDAVLLDDVERCSVYIPEGLAHGFLALQDDSTVMYLCSTSYAPELEHTIAPTDPDIDIQWPSLVSELIVSERDATAPSLAELNAAGLLPTWAAATAFVEDLRQRLTSTD